MGSAWAHSDSKGFKMQLETMPLDERITLRVASEKANNQPIGWASRPALHHKGVSTMQTDSVINPFFSARCKRVLPSRPVPAHSQVYARLPLAPVNASPVPHLISLYHFHPAG